MQAVPMGRILLADDEEIFLHSTADLLRREGYECDCVPDAEQAFEKLSGTQYDLLISDIKMPGNPDLELVHRLPQFARGLPVILVTGYPSLRSAIDSVQLPVVAYLIKPVDLDELLSHVRAYTERSRAYRVVRHAQDRLQNWYEDLNRLEQVMRNPVDSDTTVPVDAFLALTLRNIVGSLSDLQRLVESVIQNRPQQGVAVVLNYQHPTKLMSAVQETIAVLEKTKSAFKSKDLGELRKKLEGLVKDGAPCYSEDGTGDS